MAAHPGKSSAAHCVWATVYIDVSAQSSNQGGKMTVGDVDTIGVYTVRCMMRPDNPYWPRYVVFRGERRVGVQFSMPSESDCQWLERRKGQYARPDESQKDFKKVGYFVRPRGRPSRAEQARRAAFAQTDLEAEVSL